MKKNSATFILLITFVLIFVVPAMACSVCFGATQDKSAINALTYGIITLLLVLLGVLGLFTHFFLSFQKRTKQLS